MGSIKMAKLDYENLQQRKTEKNYKQAFPILTW